MLIHLNPLFSSSGILLLLCRLSVMKCFGHLLAANSRTCFTHISAQLEKCRNCPRAVFQKVNSNVMQSHYGSGEQLDTGESWKPPLGRGESIWIRCHESSLTAWSSHCFTENTHGQVQNIRWLMIFLVLLFMQYCGLVKAVKTQRLTQPICKLGKKI